MAGTFVGLPVANVPAYHAVTREGIDGLNMARVFPGNPAGSDTERPGPCTGFQHHGRHYR